MAIFKTNISLWKYSKKEMSKNYIALASERDTFIPNLSDEESLAGKVLHSKQNKLMYGAIFLTIATKVHTNNK